MKKTLYTLLMLCLSITVFSQSICVNGAAAVAAPIITQLQALKCKVVADPSTSTYLIVPAVHQKTALLYRGRILVYNNATGKLVMSKEYTAAVATDVIKQAAAELQQLLKYAGYNDK